MQIKQPLTLTVNDLKQYKSKSSTSDNTQLSLFEEFSNNKSNMSLSLFGNCNLLQKPSTAIIGDKNLSDIGFARTTKLVQLLLANGISINCNLQSGVKNVAFDKAVAFNGTTIAIMDDKFKDTVIDPKLYREFWQKHCCLVVNQIENISTGNHLKNRITAMMSDAAVVIEAPDNSDTLQHAAEFQRQHCPLFILRSLFENPNISWPREFLRNEKTFIFTDINQITNIVTP